MSLRIGTRGSALALAQTKKVAGLLADRGIETEIITITTEGDTATGVPLHAIGGQGVFVRALDEAIIRGEIDAAVHSMKDIPAARPAGTVCCAVLERDSPADFLAHEGPLDAVRIVGSSSTRRRAQLLREEPALEVKQLRGNVDTRIRKLREGQYDAIVLAEAGLQRLNLTLPGEPLPTDRFVPSPNQGTIAVVCRDDPAVAEVFAPLDHAPTRLDVEIERAVMEEVGGGCFTPQGIYCRNGNLTAEVLALDGSRWERIERHITTIDEARECGRELRRQAADLIREAYAALGIKP
ncbi:MULTISPECIES: hydroxymethylbilane synthase [Methanoculleus]|jgi:hydroxymethylbilane synthase|uniref:Hydroxymethylbilane synthase n=1 Tax=Methanoculleus thermophilus TaxID=2200 RepID=A0A1G8YM62_9EURY|nr:MULTISPECIES: hydroxymethylbilane synthase [Methanoculleus]NLN08022.1 hydroxymethylbilane synthase [Methanoculleus thermophilus]SDK03160.1 hydroxymethylbilane synthase [Methanoculleus thermophilus]HQD25521.1 hydroxymethylbilane synthase [Methanoculleus thermophilus]